MTEGNTCIAEPNLEVNSVKDYLSFFCQSNTRGDDAIRNAIALLLDGNKVVQ